MLNTTIFGLIAGSITIVSSVVIVLTVYFHKKYRRTTIWETPINTKPVTNSAPISRRTSTSCLINLERQSPPIRSRSASFSEDLTARLQNLAAGSCYRSYSPAIINLPPRSIRPSLGANIHLPSLLKPTIPSLTFQLRYENTIETLFITIFQLQNYFPIKTSQTIFLILYLLPNDDEQRQTQSSTNGVFNESFHFPLKSTELTKRTLRLTAYTVDSITRIRHVLGHVFIKFDQFLDATKSDQTFTSNTLSEYLIDDIQIRSNYLGELFLTTTYFKEQNRIHIRIEEIHHLHIEPTKTLLKGHISGQTSNISSKWINTSTFVIPSSSSSFRIDQELNLTARALIISNNEEQIECHLRFHVHGINQIHSQARWQHSLQSNTPQTIHVPLVAL